MQITLFSLCMACLWSNLIIVFIYFFRKSQIVIRFFSISGILLLYLLSLFRIALPIELPFNQIIALEGLSYVYNFLNNALFYVNNYPVSIANIILFVWATGAVILLVKLTYERYKLDEYLAQGRIEDEGRLKAIFEQIVSKNDKSTYDIFIHKELSSPACYGIFKKHIVLSDREYTDNELWYIMKHEYSHLKNKDLLFRMLVNIIFCIYWWNPIVFLLYKDMEQITELQCDITVTADMKPNEIKEYLNVLYRFLEEEQTSINSNSSILNLIRKDEDDLEERFKLIANKKYRKARTNVAIISMLIASYFLSYVFIIQSYFDVPPLDFEVNENIDEINIKNANSYIIKNEDGIYILITPRAEHVINETSAERMQKQGFKLIKEN